MLYMKAGNLVAVYLENVTLKISSVLNETITEGHRECVQKHFLLLLTYYLPLFVSRFLKHEYAYTARLKKSLNSLNLFEFEWLNFQDNINV